jgi:hypothetical protein
MGPQLSLPPSLLWTLQTRLRWTLRQDGSCSVAKVPEAVAPLSQIEFLWQDLDAVDAWVNCMRPDYDVEWVAAEVVRRRQWMTGLRRAWLLAVVFFVVFWRKKKSFILGFPTT